MVRSVVSYRNRTDIAIQILELANGGGVTKYQIAYRAFLNYGHLKQIISMLIENGFLIYESQMRTLRTTEKGLTFLQAYKQMNEMLRNKSNNKSGRKELGKEQI
jgi:predicted transcriptional regulator